jgi:hypothetical protein
LLSLKTGPWILDRHLKDLEGLIQKSGGEYRLTERGRLAYRLLAEVKRPEGELVKKASFWKRALSTFLDFVFFFGIPLIFFPFIAFLLYLGLVLVCWSVMESYNGQTLGKKILGIRVIKENGKKLSFKDAVIRNIGKALLPLDLLIGFLYKEIRFLDKKTCSKVIDEE